MTLNTEQTISNPDNPGVIIVGDGLAGLSAAIRIKEHDPDHEVLVMAPKHPASNTQIAGQRFRSGVSHQRINSAAEITHLLAERNNSVVTTEMERFGLLGEKALQGWHDRLDFLPYQDKIEWFGPQWGPEKARGLSVLRWFKQTAKQRGVQFQEGTVAAIHPDDTAVTLRDGTTLSAGKIILANGSAGGALFHSTNKLIRNSSHELAFASNLPLVDETLHMIHPFGRADTNGVVRNGCHETDMLADATVYLYNNGSRFIDQATTDLLRDHAAHEYFPDIVARFMRYGGAAILEMTDGTLHHTRVAHHYAHLGIETDDGVTTRGNPSILAIGDASAIGYWTNHRQRLPGYALLKCLVDAELVGQSIAATDHTTPIEIYPNSVAVTHESNTETERVMQDSNTKGVIRFITSQSVHRRQQAAQHWVDELHRINSDSTLHRLSMSIAKKHLAQK